MKFIKALLFFSAFALLFSSCKKDEILDVKRGGCYDDNSPDYDVSIDYDDGNCSYVYLTGYEISYHPNQDWDVWNPLGETERADLILIVTDLLDNTVIFTSTEKEDQPSNEPAQWTAPTDIKMYNRDYKWELYDYDSLDDDDFIASGEFNPIELLVKNGTIESGHPINSPSTLFKLLFDIK